MVLRLPLSLHYYKLVCQDRLRSRPLSMQDAEGSGSVLQ
jgi:hypothetical protein